MTQKHEESLAGTQPYQCFRLGPIRYVPHYTRPGIFVGPGHFETAIVCLQDRNRDVTFTAHELLALGAKRCVEHLFQRSEGEPQPEGAHIKEEATA